MIDTAYDEGKLEGIQEGKLEGIREGKLEGKLEMARTMKLENEPVDKIIRYTGLTKEQIELI